MNNPGLILAARKHHRALRVAAEETLGAISTGQREPQAEPGGVLGGRPHRPGSPWGEDADCGRPAELESKEEREAPGLKGWRPCRPAGRTTGPESPGLRGANVPREEGQTLRPPVTPKTAGRGEEGRDLHGTGRKRRARGDGCLGQWH